MNKLRNFHEGEAQIQREAGVDTEAFDAMVEHAFRPELSEVEARFVNGRTFSVAASVDATGRPWASPLLGAEGELFRVESATAVRVAAPAVDGDPLLENIAASGELGVLYFDPSRRRRAKSTGKGRVDGSTISYVMQRNFGLCNKYIYKRTHEPQRTTAVSVPGERRVALSDDDRNQLEATDTVFLASFHPKHGADPTHRGGPAGFVTVVDERTISLPDYMGNGMFQTLGNLLLDDRIGLLELDYATGRALHVTGRGRVAKSPADDEFSSRTLVIDIDEVRVSHHQVGTWSDVEEFPIRPGLINPATPYVTSPS